MVKKNISLYSPFNKWTSLTGRHENKTLDGPFLSSAIGTMPHQAFLSLVKELLQYFAVQIRMDSMCVLLPLPTPYLTP
jgi:hypothetical protein